MAEILSISPIEAGIFAWDLSKNLVYGDSALASLFGLSAKETAHGLPVEDYLERVHPDDRPRLAKVIRDTILSQLPLQESYRAQQRNGIYVAVVCFGRSFSDRSGIPVLYSGIVVPAGDDG